MNRVDVNRERTKPSPKCLFKVKNRHFFNVMWSFIVWKTIKFSPEYSRTLKESIVLINHTDCMPFFGYAVILKKLFIKVLEVCRTFFKVKINRIDVNRERTKPSPKCPFKVKNRHFFNVIWSLVVWKTIKCSP